MWLVRLLFWANLFWYRLEIATLVRFLFGVNSVVTCEITIESKSHLARGVCRINIWGDADFEKNGGKGGYPLKNSSVLTICKWHDGNFSQFSWFCYFFFPSFLPILFRSAFFFVGGGGAPHPPCILLHTRLHLTIVPLIGFFVCTISSDVPCKIVIVSKYLLSQYTDKVKVSLLYVTF